MLRPTCFIAALLGTAALACGARQHMTETQAASYRAAFSRQPVAIAQKGPAAPATGLDSQEAALISDAYRRSLLPKTIKQPQQITEEPIILVTPPSTSSRYGTMPLAPSVPKE